MKYKIACDVCKKPIENMIGSARISKRVIVKGSVLNLDYEHKGFEHVADVCADCLTNILKGGKR